MELAGIFSLFKHFKVFFSPGWERRRETSCDRNRGYALYDDILVFIVLRNENIMMIRKSRTPSQGGTHPLQQTKGFQSLVSRPRQISQSFVSAIIDVGLAISCISSSSRRMMLTCPPSVICPDDSLDTILSEGDSVLPMKPYQYRLVTFVEGFWDPLLAINDEVFRRAFYAPQKKVSSVLIRSNPARILYVDEESSTDCCIKKRGYNIFVKESIILHYYKKWFQWEFLRNVCIYSSSALNGLPLVVVWW